MPATTVPRTTKLPPIFAACCDEAPPLDTPWIEGRMIFATDGRIAARSTVDDFPREAIATLPNRTGHVTPPVRLWFRRWIGGGAILTLPADAGRDVACPRCEGGEERATCLACEASGRVPDRRRIAVGPGLDLASYRVAILVEHGVRAVRAGSGPRAPVRFECGAVEGLLMPMIERAR